MARNWSLKPYEGSFWNGAWVCSAFIRMYVEEFGFNLSMINMPDRSLRFNESQSAILGEERGDNGWEGPLAITLLAVC